MKEEAVILFYFIYFFLLFGYIILGFTGGSAGKESVCNAGDLGLIPGLGRSPGEGNGNPLQYSCLKNSMDRGGLWATVHEAAELDRTEGLSTHTLRTQLCLFCILSSQTA